MRCVISLTHVVYDGEKIAASMRDVKCCCGHIGKIKMLMHISMSYPFVCGDGK